MTELEYRKLLIDTIRADDYEDKESLLELLKIATLRFEKTNVFTRNLWNHFQEYIHICIVPEIMVELKKHIKYLEQIIYDMHILTGAFRMYWEYDYYNCPDDPDTGIPACGDFPECKRCSWYHLIQSAQKRQTD